MATPNEFAVLVTDLVDVSKQYLRDQTLEPARRLGRLAGFGIGGAMLVAVSSVFFGLAAFALLRAVLPEGAWWSVAARGFTTVLLAGSAGIIGWRMSR